MEVAAGTFFGSTKMVLGSNRIGRASQLKRECCRTEWFSYNRSWRGTQRGLGESCYADGSAAVIRPYRTTGTVRDHSIT